MATMRTARLNICQAALLSVLIYAIQVDQAEGQGGDEYLVGVGMSDVTGPAAELNMVISSSVYEAIFCQVNFHDGQCLQHINSVVFVFRWVMPKSLKLSKEFIHDCGPELSYSKPTRLLPLLSMFL